MTNYLRFNAPTAAEVESRKVAAQRDREFTTFHSCVEREGEAETEAEHIYRAPRRVRPHAA